MNDYLFFGILLLSAIVAGWLLYIFVAVLLNRWLRFISLRGFKIGLGPIKRPLCFLLPVLCIALTLPLSHLPEKASSFVSHLINIALILFFSWVVIKIIYIVRDAGLEHYNVNVKDNARARGMHTQIRLITNIIAVIVIVFTIAFILMTFPQVKQIGVTILASAGIIGIVIGLAAQKTLGNLIAGIQIAIAQPIRLDDVVIVENEWGKIEEITLTYVVVRIWDLRRLVVPISYFLEKSFQNWTRTSADLLGIVLIYADYTIPVKDMREELTRILNNSSLWDKKINVLQVTNMTEKTVELRALMSAADSSSLWDLRCEVRERLLEFLQAHFPHCLPRMRLEMKE
jgi:small-conductance mechanosensitive channel